MATPCITILEMDWGGRNWWLRVGHLLKQHFYKPGCKQPESNKSDCFCHCCWIWHHFCLASTIAVPSVTTSSCLDPPMSPTTIAFAVPLDLSLLSCSPSLVQLSPVANFILAYWPPSWLLASPCSLCHSIYVLKKLVKLCGSWSCSIGVCIQVDCISFRMTYGKSIPKPYKKLHFKFKQVF